VSEGLLHFRSRKPLNGTYFVVLNTKKKYPPGDEGGSVEGVEGRGSLDNDMKSLAKNLNLMMVIE
jgi:hypothetical protein